MLEEEAHKLEMELSMPSPRGVPEEIRQDVSAGGLRDTAGFWLLLAVCAWGARNIDQDAAPYGPLLPFIYLGPIAIFFALISVIYLILWRYNLGRYPYSQRSVGASANDRFTPAHWIPTVLVAYILIFLSWCLMKAFPFFLLSLKHQILIIAGGVMLGSLVLSCVFWLRRDLQSGRRTARRFERCVDPLLEQGSVTSTFLVALAWTLGCLLSVGPIAAINAWQDSSSPTYLTVDSDGFAYINWIPFRDYNVSYRRPGRDEEFHQVLCRVPESGAGNLELEIRGGRLGIPWVSGFRGYRL